MKTRHPNRKKKKSKNPMVLVAVDFSHCSRLALRKAKAWAAISSGEIIVIHVIDQEFIRKCVHQQIGTEEEIKKRLFINSKKKLREFLQKEGMGAKDTRVIVCEGTACMEINKKAVEYDVEMVIMGSKGNSDDLKAIFFGSTTERVLRFIKRPVLCIPPETTYNLKN